MVAKFILKLSLKINSVVKVLLNAINTLAKYFQMKALMFNFELIKY